MYIIHIYVCVSIVLFKYRYNQVSIITLFATVSGTTVSKLSKNEVKTENNEKTVYVSNNTLGELHFCHIFINFRGHFT